MSAATSCSDRYAEAQSALAYHDTLYQAGEILSGTQHRLAEAIRALIVPAQTEGTPEEIEGAYNVARKRYNADDYTIRGAHLAGLEGVYQYGIQAAWESWEPENAPGHRGTMTRAQIEDAWDRAEVQAHIDYDFLRDFVTNLGIEAV